MSSQRQLVSGRDLVEEAKKRIVILSICVVGLSYLMSLTSTSVWVNLPAAAVLIIIFRYFQLDFELRRKEAVYNSRTSGKVVIQEKLLDSPKASVKIDHWRKKVNSPPVEDAIDQLTRHIVSEWVTDLWYSKLTPDRNGPEELVHLMNGVLGEISYRFRHINLIDLLMRDVIHLVCKHLEVFRICQAKIKKDLAPLSFDQRDIELKLVMAAENKLHPLLFSAEAEHKVLQHIVDGLLSLTFKPEDLQCSFFHYVSRELLACAVMRPVLNLANPRFINERIEQVVMSARKGSEGAATANNPSPSKQNGDASDQFSPFPDPSASGVELVELKSMQPKSSMDKHKLNGEAESKDASKDPLLSVDTRSTRSWSSFPLGSAAAGGGQIDRSTSGGQWGDMLDYFSRRKTQALAPEHFENMWSKGRNYSSKDTQTANHVHQNSSTRSDAVRPSKVVARQKDNGLKITSADRGAILAGSNMKPQSETMCIHTDTNTLTPPPLTSDEDDEEHKLLSFDETESVSSGPSSSGDEENKVTGLDTPTTKVWDGKTNRNSGVSHIHHPLEGLERKKGRRANKGQNQRLHRQQTGRKRSRLSSQKRPLWQEVERTSFLPANGQDVHPLKPNVKDDDSSDDYDMEIINRLQSGTSASSSASLLLGSFQSSVSSPQTAFLGDSFFKLRCEVLGANIVTSSSKTFAVYSISVTDAESNSWSIKRRYRHFEELHRRLKEYEEYHLHLPPKHFLSTGLDVPVIQERCKLLDQYLKRLMQLPTISGSIDVWDFLSIDSQTYTFSSAFSIIETLSVKPHENSANCLGGPKMNHLQPKRYHDQSPGMNHSSMEGLNSDMKSTASITRKNTVMEGDLQQKSESVLEATDDSTFPVEWVPPDLSGPILDLVDVVFQLQEGAWIRRKAFWVAKQVLQLGMGDALDDWLVEKIQRLRRGSVVASGIKRVEQILWPDGIFITKHPNRQKPPAPSSPSQSSIHSQLPDQLSSPKAENFEKIADLQENESDRRAKFVHDLMIDNAPAAVVSIVGRKEYEQCAKDLYYFLQSSVCLKQLVIDLLQLVLLYAFPELDHVFKQLHEEKQKFGEFKAT